MVHLQRDLSVQRLPGVPGVRVLLLVRGSQELQQHQRYPEQQTRGNCVTFCFGVLALVDFFVYVIFAFHININNKHP